MILDGRRPVRVDNRYVLLLPLLKKVNSGELRLRLGVRLSRSMESSTPTSILHYDHCDVRISTSARSLARRCFQLRAELLVFVPEQSPSTSRL